MGTIDCVNHLPVFPIQNTRIARSLAYPNISIKCGARHQKFCGRSLFAKSIRGADASVVVYSIAETALMNGLKPYIYLTYILDELRKMEPFLKPYDLNRLLPWSDELPEEFRTKQKK